MEEVLSLIFHGCKLVKDLETNLPNLANQPGHLGKSCDEIVRVFGDTRERLNALVYGQQMMHHEDHQLQASGLMDQVRGGGGDAVVQELLRFSQAMDHMVVFHHASQQVQHHMSPVESSRVGDQRLEVIRERELGGGDAAVQPMDHEQSGGGSAATLQRSRRRNEADRRTIRVPAPRIGNTEVPPEDGYTWRKYGQKEILGSRFPRGYYRCTHQKLYSCPAKKQVQRLDHDPYMYEVTYRGDHTCIMSATAPSIPPPPPIAPTASQSPPPPASSVPLSHWLSVDIRPSGEQGSSSTSNSTMPMYSRGPIFGLGGSGGGAGHSGTTTMSASGRGSTGGAAGLSMTVRYVDYHQQAVADLADAMFNSGSSSNNSMELIFSGMEDKWEGADGS